MRKLAVAVLVLLIMAGSGFAVVGFVPAGSHELPAGRWIVLPGSVMSPAIIYNQERGVSFALMKMDNGYGDWAWCRIKCEKEATQ